MADWNWATPPDSGTITRTALRYCPEFPFEPIENRTYEAPLSCYEDYRLVRLTGESGAALKEVYGLYAPGDFRPVDRKGRSILHINRVAPMILRRETALDYLRLRVGFELPAVEDVDGGPDDWLPTLLVESFEDIPVEREDLPQRIREELERHFSTSVLTAAEQTSQEDSFDVRTFVLFRYVDGRRDLVRLSAILKNDGELSVRELERLLTFRVPGHESPITGVRFPRRTRVPHVELTWETLSRNEEPSWYEVLDDFDVRNENLVLRRADLSFYGRFRLLEVLEPKQATYRRSYALASSDEGRPDLRPMNGKAGLIHAVNAIPDELQLDESTADDYLRFFCWAVHGEQGPFSIPLTFRELDFEDAPTKEQRQTLREIDFSVRPLADADPQRTESPKDAPPVFRRLAQIAHGSTIFEAWFAIDETGGIAMDHDEPRIADLPLHEEHYGRDDLFVLQKWTELRGERPRLRHYAQEWPPEDGAQEDERPAELDLERLSAQEFHERLSRTAMVSRAEVTEPLILGAESMRSDGHAD